MAQSKHKPNRRKNNRWERKGLTRIIYKQCLIFSKIHSLRRNYRQTSTWMRLQYPIDWQNFCRPALAGSRRWNDAILGHKSLLKPDAALQAHALIAAEQRGAAFEESLATFSAYLAEYSSNVASLLVPVEEAIGQARFPVFEWWAITVSHFIIIACRAPPTPPRSRASCRRCGVSSAAIACAARSRCAPTAARSAIEW